MRTRTRGGGRLRPPLVHGHRRAAEELRHHARASCEGALDDGMGFDGSSITGFNPIEESDMVAIPDPTTFQVLPWKTGEHKVARMICDVVTPDGEPVRGRPALRPAARARADALDGLRHVQRRPRARVLLLQERRGHGDPRPRRLLRPRRRSTSRPSGARRRSRPSSRWGSRSSTPTTRSRPRSTRSTCGTPTRSTMADHTVTYRLIVKEIATKYGIYATFMPKPLFGQNGSGMHTHQSLFADGKNAFYDRRTSRTTSPRPASSSSPGSSTTRARSARSSPSG